MRVPDDVIAVLDRCTFEQDKLFLPEQLDRREYVAVDRVLREAGGKWDRRQGAHVFHGDAAEIADLLITTREVTAAHKALGYFSTPPAVVAKLIELADLGPDMIVLEPSAGTGAIVKALSPLVSAVVACEIDPGRAAALRDQGITALHEGDFLALTPDHIVFDRVVMNPPFAKLTDIDHVLHARRFLHPDSGRLVSVMSAGVTFRTTRKAENFRKLVADCGGWFIDLPDESFKPSGTSISTVIVVIPGGTAA